MMNTLHENEKRSILEFIDRKKDIFSTVSRKIWEYAELGFEENQSAALLCETLCNFGFQVQEGIGNIRTAFMGSYGTGGPVIAFLGEYDALPGLSQKAGSAAQEEFEAGANGHGCGHNLLGTASLAAAIAVKDYLQRTGCLGTVRFYGCPAEENGAGKVIMTQNHYFDGVDTVFAWHPMDVNMVECRSSLAVVSTRFQFTGVSAHAAASPHLGRSALDAVELLNVGVNFLREHVIPEARIHYAITDAGGQTPNIVQSHAEVYYETRAPRFQDALEIRERVCNVARGASLMTDTAVKIIDGDRYADYIPNRVLSKLLYESLIQIGPPPFTEEEQQFAEEIQKTLPENAIKNSVSEVLSLTPEISGAMLQNKVLADWIIPYHGNHGILSASTDVGDVSHLIPTAQLYTACCAFGTPAHSWQKTSQSCSGIGEKGMLAAAKTLALTAIQLICQTDLIEQAWAELGRARPNV